MLDTIQKIWTRVQGVISKSHMWFYRLYTKLMKNILNGDYTIFIKQGLAHTAAFFTMVTLVLITTVKVIPATVEFGYDAVVITTLSKKDTYVFSKAEEVEGRPDVYRVFACRKTPCEAQIDSIEYRIRDSMFMDAVYLTRYGIPYDTGELAGAFLAEKNKCEIKWYGKRRKFLGAYPKIVTAKCEVVSN
jgi:hypothetical protein